MGRLTPEEWTLLAVAAARGRSLTPVQLQKSLFLLGKECQSDVGSEFYEFDPYNYGPFSKRIYIDAEALVGQGLVALVPHAGGSWKDYAATAIGTKRASDLAARAPSKALEYLGRVVKWTSEQDFADLVRWIYSRYPEYRANSLFTE